MTERTRSPFVPLLILLAALLAWTVFQTVQLRGESESLGALRAGQETQFQQAQRVRRTLDQLATQTQSLADAGNPNARIVVEELRKRGVTINRQGDAAKK